MALDVEGCFFLRSPRHAYKEKVSRLTGYRSRIVTYRMPSRRSPPREALMDGCIRTKLVRIIISGSLCEGHGKHVRGMGCLLVPITAS